MVCKYLNQFFFLDSGWAVQTCTASERPYIPSIFELKTYCSCNDFKRCPVLLKKEDIHINNDFEKERLVAL